MAIAAVPDYLGKDFSTASPGLRFGLFFSAWQSNFSIGKDSKVPALKAIGRLGNHKTVMQAIAQRQNLLAKATDHTFTIEAIATAPFTTGLGNEHPTENGFAFLNPYGLPYLPGSGIKGVLRQAARELASGQWGDCHGWDQEKPYTLTVGRTTIELSVLDVLFGKESKDGDKEHLRGVLSFWDALPQIPGDSLAVDIMTPHQSHYYQDGRNPHDSGQPNPISFLTLPPGTGFTFHVRCDLPRLKRIAKRIASDLAEDRRWQTLLNAAFEHAFAWLGFGAKTAVGYGAMEVDPEIRAKQEKKAAEERERAEHEKREKERELELSKLSPIDRIIREIMDARTDPNLGEIPALKNAIKDGQWDDDTKRDLAMRLRDLMQAAKRWREQSTKKNPAKDTVYQDTLLVKSWLDEK